MSSSRDHGPDAPTRLAERIRKSDQFCTEVFYIDESDTFLVVDYDAKAEPYDVVIIARVGAEEITLAIYDGQSYLGVARILEFYPLDQSEQWNPRINILGWPH